MLLSGDFSHLISGIKINGQFYGLLYTSLIITWRRVLPNAFDKPTFPTSRITLLKMGWDRVIQDSDEEEPLIEDGFPASPDPLQDPQPPKPQHHNHLAQQETYPTEHTVTEGFPGPQLNVNFDQFLQSQGTHTGSTSSQQQREERWIPSTKEGAGGSISASRSNDGCLTVFNHLAVITC